MSEAFTLLDTRLSPGITLLAAGAGTGKTYALVGLCRPPRSARLHQDGRRDAEAPRRSELARR